jgi:hypothetical protein
MKDADESQSVETRFAVKTRIDLEPAHRFTETVGRKRVELARAAVSAIAVDKLSPLKGPLHVH